jgi:CHAT domain-containing protein
VLAPRELAAMAVQESRVVDLVTTLAQGHGARAAHADLAGDALLVSQALLAVETRSARRSRLVRARDPERAAGLTKELRTATDDVSRLAARSADGGADAGSATLGPDRAHQDRLARAVARKEELQRELVALAGDAATPESEVVVTDLTAALPERSAAVAIVAYAHTEPGVTLAGQRTERRLLGFVLCKDRPLQVLPLGRVDAVLPAVEALLADGRSAQVRGLSAKEKGNSGARAAGARLVKLLIAPLLERCGAIDTLYLTVDDVLDLVPFDALPFDERRLVGERVAIRTLLSLFDLRESHPPANDRSASLLVAGGIDYERLEPDAAVSLDAEAAAPVLERTGGEGAWAALPGTAREAQRIAELFGEAFGRERVRLLADERASKREIADSAAGATFVHLATHGYFAAGPEPAAPQVAGRAPAFDTFVGTLSPLSLTGLALSGANRAADAMGRRAGILTAEEILSLDLSGCELVTLSACSTSLGVRRAGQGYASLRAALAGAGARYVLTSLWRVGDEATMELMADFYQRLWLQKKDPHTALWEARLAGRTKGHAFRDWAGWTLTGL